MVQIYDMARALDQRGVVPPPTQAAQIRLGESQARISERGEARTETTQVREDTAYQQQQQAYKYSKAMQHIRRSLSVPQSPQAYLETIERLLKEEIIPEEMYAMFEGVRAEIPDLLGEPAKMQELRGDLDNMLGGFVNELDRLKIKGRQEVAETKEAGAGERLTEKQIFEKEEAELDREAKKKLADDRNATQKDITEANNISREKIVEAKAQETGIDPVKLSKLYAAADDALRDEFVDRKTGLWSLDSGLWKETITKRKYWFDAKVTNFDFEKYEQWREKKVQKMLDKTQGLKEIGW